MWNADGELQDTKAVIPDSSYAGVYQVVIEDCKAQRRLRPATMGSVPNVGLMAQKAEEYGSHDKTFEIADRRHRPGGRATGTAASSSSTRSSAGDIWRACQTKDAADPGLGEARRHPGPGQRHARRVLARQGPRPRRPAHREGHAATSPTTTPTASTSRSWRPSRPPQFSLERIRQGEDTISVTGNVLRDYLTDLFPILELGTSAKMLSIVPLMNGGGLFETGAGGSAPKHVQQFVEGEPPALGLARRVPGPGRLARAPAPARRQPPGPGAGRRPRQGHRHAPRRGPVARPARSARSTTAAATSTWPCYWAEALAAQTADAELAAALRPGGQAALADDEAAIVAELIAVQGEPVDIGGYYSPDPAKAPPPCAPAPPSTASSPPCPEPPPGRRGTPHRAGRHRAHDPIRPVRSISRPAPRRTSSPNRPTSPAQPRSSSAVMTTDHDPCRRPATHGR